MFLAADGPLCLRISVVGEVFPEGGVVVRRIVPLQREAEGCAAGAVCRKLVEDTLEPPGIREVALSAGKDKRENFKRPLPQPTARNRKGAASFFVAPFLRQDLS